MFRQKTFFLCFLALYIGSPEVSFAVNEACEKGGPGFNAVGSQQAVGPASPIADIRNLEKGQKISLGDEALGTASEFEIQTPILKPDGSVREYIVKKPGDPATYRISPRPTAKDKDRHILERISENADESDDYLGAFSARPGVAATSRVGSAPGRARQAVTVGERSFDPSRFKITPPREFGLTIAGPGNAGDYLLKTPEGGFLRFNISDKTKEIKIKMLTGSPDTPGVGAYLKTRLAEMFPGYRLRSSLALENANKIEEAMVNLAKKYPDPSMIPEVELNAALMSVPSLRTLNIPYELNVTFNSSTGRPEFGAFQNLPETLTSGTDQIRVTNREDFVNNPKFKEWFSSLRSQQPTLPRPKPEPVFATQYTRDFDEIDDIELIPRLQGAR